MPLAPRTQHSIGTYRQEGRRGVWKGIVRKSKGKDSDYRMCSLTIECVLLLWSMCLWKSKGKDSD